MLSVENETLKKASLFLSLYKKAFRLHKYSINRLVMYPVILLNVLVMWKHLRILSFFSQTMSIKSKIKAKKCVVVFKKEYLEIT